ncbi:putative ABC transporter permease protein [Actinoplanes missouriensis 431]|uniref:Putative ABC transporter permease protein n=1 Tax=Actinoplanes missouriensis (strain ATCC 14538 / DSM 43046 / CBS 188.64 / JCM 3121 / NBRC 102363 / NCIMB 12654 / NRRL B-3342 / UNCC 431) TaxID=512565 RepID=I0H5M9_ACTM4|nr:ABC transporter permease [Actinoplanes missouriensis]BAL88316.1 putative ABC transporter permease protein [Actinoplanes missouriensis 431]
MSRIHSSALPLLGAVTAVALWWSATAVFGIRSFFLPAPPDIVAAFRRQPGYLMREAGSTVTVTVTGFGIAVAAGLLLAVVLTAWRALERATLPVLVALNSVPKVAVAPLLVVWLGFGAQPKIVLVVLICFFPVVVATMAGLTSTPAELSELSRSLSASVWQAYLKIRLPWALPQMFVGLKVAISLAVIGAVVAEINNPTGGLGSVIVLSGMSFDTPLAFAAIALLALLSTTLFYLVVLLERLVVPWARAISG